MAELAEAWLLWHVHHGIDEDAQVAIHRDEMGEVPIDECRDDVKLLGVFSSATRAEAATRKYLILPGFRDEPDCFIVDGHDMNVREWTDGFVSD